MTGIDFIGLQVRDIERAAGFYRDVVGLPEGPRKPDAVVFASAPIPFAVRTPLPGTDLDAGPAGLGVAIWVDVPDLDALTERLHASGTEIVREVAPSPFGPHLAFRDLDGYVITAHQNPA